MSAWGGGPDDRLMCASVPTGQPPPPTDELRDRCVGQSIAMQRADDVL
jgi:hypothetical protein